MNWGWRIAIFLTCFIGFIMYMVIYSFGVNGELVADDYYNQEVQYQLNIDAQKNGFEFAKEVELSSTENGVLISFPKSFNLSYQKGDISFYRPDNSKLDKSFAMNLGSDNTQNLDQKALAKGFYTVTIQFVSEGKMYLINKEIWV